jgi:hypothetical protein
VALVPDAGSLRDKIKPSSKDFEASSVATEENTYQKYCSRFHIKCSFAEEVPLF